MDQANPIEEPVGEVVAEAVDLPTPPAKPVKPSKTNVTTPATTDESDSASQTQKDTNNLSEKIADMDLNTTVADSQFKISDKGLKNVDDILAADKDDESLQRYKASLLGSAIHGDTGDKADPRRLIITEFRVSFAPEEKLADIVHDLSSESGLSKLKSEGISIREGAKFKFKISFKVQHEIVVGIKFTNKLSKMMFSDTEELALGSYPPSSSTVQNFEFPKWDYREAPKGMLYRGTYKANNSFVDSDGATHLKIEYEVHIKK